MPFSLLALLACEPSEPPEATAWVAAEPPDESSAPLLPPSDEGRSDEQAPERRSVHHGRFRHDRILFHRRRGTTFDLELGAEGPDSATVVARGLDLALLVPKAPSWLSDPELRDLALQSQEWSRVEMQLDASERILIGEGFEQALFTRLDLTNSGSRAGLWEVSLFTREDGLELPYFQAWFELPRALGAALFEQANGRPWAEAEGTLTERSAPTPRPVDLSALRSPIEERPVTPKDRGAPTRPARLASVESAVIRRVTPRGGPLPQAAEIEIVFRSEAGEQTRLVVGGFDLASLPALPLAEHHQGLQVPMGIGSHGFHQTWDQGLARSPDAPRYALLLDAGGQRLDSREIGLDGALLYLDDRVPDRLHLMSLSSEGSAVAGHVELPVSQL